ncbi:MAG TPA: dTDP-4-dehydrorhamnose 3,5-epimerase family protein [Aggregatilineales bacterium]|nr:dTDP-4-dehydrorhamnose 3,5-epimerase family protein [Aggregatilineales bacterium]
MIFTPLTLPGAYRIAPEPHPDDRGWFGRMFCQEEFKAHGLNPCVAQCNLSYNKVTGTLRGLHYQAAPHAEAKLIRPLTGAICAVMIDLRPESPTYKAWIAHELRAETFEMLYTPEGIANGFLTLEDNTQVFYQMSEFYHPESAHGIRWNDPAFGIAWPAAPRVISSRDQQYPDTGL